MRIRSVMGLAAHAALGIALTATGPLALAASPMSADDLARAITAWAKHEMQQGSGILKIEDPLEKKTLSLTLHEVHKEKILESAPDTWGLCSEFFSSDAHTYEIDVFMKGPDKDHLAVAETVIHKKDGVERYELIQDGAVWRVPGAAGAGKSAPNRGKRQVQAPTEPPASRPTPD